VCAKGFYRSATGACIVNGTCSASTECPGAKQVCCGPETDKPGTCVDHGKEGSDRACFKGRKR
jgi:hypothetical protein